MFSSWAVTDAARCTSPLVAFMGSTAVRFAVTEKRDDKEDAKRELRFNLFELVLTVREVRSG